MAYWAAWMIAAERRGREQIVEAMMDRATVIYNALDGSVGRGDMARHRVQLAEAMVGEDMEKRGT